MSMLIDEIVTLLNTKAEGQYGLSNVTQKQHALQCAMLAEQAGETPQIIVAALVHDIGHMLHEIGENFADRGIDDHHEEIGMNYLKDRFGPDVVMPIALHVQAKRYLCATQADYFAKLSDDSVKSMALQGGPMNQSEIKDFEARPHWQAALRLRRFDDLAKVAGAITPEPEHFRSYLEACAQTA